MTDEKNQRNKDGRKIPVIGTEEADYERAPRRFRRAVQIRLSTLSKLAHAGSSILWIMIQPRRIDDLRPPGRPSDFHAIHARASADAEMKSALILRAESAAARNFLYLLLPVPEYPDLGSYCAPIAGAAFELKFDPLILWRYFVLIQQQGTPLICRYCVERSVVIQVGERHRAAVKPVRHADELRNFFELSGSVVEPHALLLIAG